jgi:hypothetical protein
MTGDGNVAAIFLNRAGRIKPLDLGLGEESLTTSVGSSEEFGDRFTWETNQRSHLQLRRSVNPKISSPHFLSKVLAYRGD